MRRFSPGACRAQLGNSARRVRQKDDTPSGHFILRVVDVQMGRRYRHHDGYGQGRTVIEAMNPTTRLGRDAADDNLTLTAAPGTGPCQAPEGII